MTDFLIIKLLKTGTIIYPTSFSLGPVEVRPPKCDTPEERKYLEESLMRNNEHVELDIGTRLACIVENSDDWKEAVNIVQPVFEEALDVMRLDSLGVASFALLQSGVIRDLSCGQLFPIINEKYIPSPTNMYRVQGYRYPEISHKEYILANKNSIELCERFLKSLHWSRHAGWEKNLQMRILFNWFSIEALLKRDEGDNIAPKAMLAMGFPIGQKKNDVDIDFLKKLENHPNYENWKKILTNDMEKIREYRNNSVHSGFRPWDLSDFELRKFSFLTEMAQVSCQKLAQYAISSDCKTEIDLYTEAPKLLSKIDNLINFVHGTLIYSLDNQNYKWY